MKWLLLAAAVCFAPIGQAGELEMLRERCAEQERQIRDLETEAGRLRAELQQRANEGVIPVGSGAVLGTDEAGEAGKIGSDTSKNVYTVKKGDTLTSIARHFNTTVAALIKRNSISDPSRLAIGDKLEIPPPQKASPTPPTGSPASSPAASGGKTYKVRKGDTLYSIARRYRTSIESLLKANPDLNPTRLRIGQVIRLADEPAKPAAPEVGPPTPAAQPAPAPATAGNQAAPARESKIDRVRLSEKMTFGDFAAKHGVTVEQLNEMNGQNLTATTLLDVGSELYVPIQP